MLGRWTFDTPEIAKAFDGHVRGHLPWYDMVTDAVALAVKHYIPPGGLVYDIGCGNGNMGRALAPVLDSRRARLIAVDSSIPMCANYKGPGKVVCSDICAVNFEAFDVAVSMLTLMFLSPEDQERVLRMLRTYAIAGGAIVLVEKVGGSGGYVQTVMQRMTFAAKVKQGTGLAEVMGKELSLVGVQRPLDPKIIYNTFPNAAEIFRFGEFVGYLIEVNG